MNSSYLHVLGGGTSVYIGEAQPSESERAGKREQDTHACNSVTDNSLFLPPPFSVLTLRCTPTHVIPHTPNAFYYTALKASPPPPHPHAFTRPTSWGLRLSEGLWARTLNPAMSMKKRVMEENVRFQS